MTRVKVLRRSPARASAGLLGAWFGFGVVLALAGTAIVTAVWIALD